MQKPAIRKSPDCSKARQLVNILKTVQRKHLFQIRMPEEIMNNEQTITIEAVVCPQCFKPIQAQVLPAQTNRYQTEFRTYLGYCFKCNCGWEVVQFKKTQGDPPVALWLIHKYQKYPVRMMGTDGCSATHPMGMDTIVEKCHPSGKWTMLNEMPEPAPVLTGPGGEYDKEWPPGIKGEVTPETSELLGNFQKALNAVNQAIECLIRHFQK